MNECNEPHYHHNGRVKTEKIKFGKARKIARESSRLETKEKLLQTICDFTSKRELERKKERRVMKSRAEIMGIDFCCI